MKRFASHFLYIPSQGYLQQYVVETERGCVVHAFPLVDELESVEWLPGVIALLTEEQARLLKSSWNVFKANEMLHALPEFSLSDRIPYLFSPFDFTKMQPDAGTRHRLLR